MRVVIEYEDGAYYLRAFREGYDAGAYAAPSAWGARAVTVPDHLVVAYAALAAQRSTMSTLLRMIDDDKETS